MPNKTATPWVCPRIPTVYELENCINLFEQFRIEDQVYAGSIRFDYYSPEDTFEETLIF